MSGSEVGGVGPPAVLSASGSDEDDSGLAKALIALTKSSRDSAKAATISAESAKVSADAANKAVLFAYGRADARGSDVVVAGVLAVSLIACCLAAIVFPKEMAALR